MFRQCVRRASTWSHNVQLNTQAPGAPRYLKSKAVGVVGVPVQWGQPKGGVETGPDVLRKAKFEDDLIAEGWNVTDYGNLDVSKVPGEGNFGGRVLHPKTVGAVNKRLYDSYVQRAKQGMFALNLGGDHSLGTGSLTGALAAYPDAAIIWVDAHADINTPETSNSGNIHGMPVSIAMKLGMKLPGYEWLDDAPTLKPENIVYFGLRDVDKGEREILRRNNILAFSMHDIDRFGVGEVVNRAFNYLFTHGDRPIHLSFDIDALDPFFAPSTGTAVPGGLSMREGNYICEAIAQTTCLVGMDMVEVNPALTGGRGAESTVDMAKTLILSGMGKFLL